MPRYYPDLNEFEKLATQGFDLIPVHRRLLADRITPVMAFEVLGRDPNAFLLESVIGGETVGRYSFLGTSPRSIYQAAHATGRLHHPSAGWEKPTADPLDDLARSFPPRRYYRAPNLPAFTGGLVGYAAYDVARYHEPKKLNSAPPDDRKLPDVLFGFYDELVIFDQVDKTVKVVAHVDLGTSLPLPQAYADACRRVDALVRRISQPPSSSLGELDFSAEPIGGLTSNMTRDQFEAAVRVGLEYIRAGDIFQFVPSQRFRIPSAASPLDVYRALRVINPSPFMFFLKSPVCTLIGSSPEILCRVQDGRVTTRPLAGTRPRGSSVEEDIRLEQELLSDPKERAEHIMLVDLHRNDLGRVCKPGSVRVDDTMTVERYSHVMHITSNVSGELADGRSALDALRATLPVGTVSGAPKIRAMQIIDEVEPTRRGPYGGAVGYVDLSGNMDMCIALRTLVWRNGLFDIQAGAGVVADSDPAREYEETVRKARALVKAIAAAEQQL
jgi:anthranilate synthase component 1